MSIPFLISGWSTLKGDLRRGGNWSALSSKCLSSLSKPMLTYHHPVEWEVLSSAKVANSLVIPSVYLVEALGFS